MLLQKNRAAAVFTVQLSQPSPPPLLLLLQLCLNIMLPGFKACLLLLRFHASEAEYSVSAAHHI
jgi:hypothetical protein